jgi:hypothetical protein
LDWEGLDLECDIDVGWYYGATPPCGESQTWVSGCTVIDVGYWEEISWWLPDVWVPDYDCSISFYTKSQECQ